MRRSCGTGLIIILSFFISSDIAWAKEGKCFDDCLKYRGSKIRFSGHFTERCGRTKRGSFVCTEAGTYQTSPEQLCKDAKNQVELAAGCFLTNPSSSFESFFNWAVCKKSPAQSMCGSNPTCFTADQDFEAMKGAVLTLVKNSIVVSTICQWAQTVQGLEWHDLTSVPNLASFASSFLAKNKIACDLGSCIISKTNPHIEVLLHVRKHGELMQPDSAQREDTFNAGREGLILSYQDSLNLSHGEAEKIVRDNLIYQAPDGPHPIDDYEAYEDYIVPTLRSPELWH